MSLPCRVCDKSVLPFDISDKFGHLGGKKHQKAMQLRAHVWSKQRKNMLYMHVISA